MRSKSFTHAIVHLHMKNVSIFTIDASVNVIESMRVRFCLDFEISDIMTRIIQSVTSIEPSTPLREGDL